MAKYRFLCCKLFSVCTVATILSSYFVTVVSLTSNEDSRVKNVEDGLNITALPPNVALIVEAISNVQKNVSKTASNSKVPNIKVAGLTNNNGNFRRNFTSSNEINPELELQLYEPEESLTPERLDVKNEQTSETDDVLSSSATSTEKSSNSVVNVKDTNGSAGVASQTTLKEENKPNVSDQEAETAEETSTVLTALEPPATGLLSFDGVRQWLNWIWSMRDPDINPEGPLSWPTILGRGVSTIIRYYNPLRRIFGMRSLNGPVSTNSLSKEHPYYDEIFKAIKNKEISGDSKSIKAYVHKLERAKIAEKISAMSSTDKNALGKQDDTIEVEPPEPLISFRPLAAPLANAIQSIRNFTGEIESALFAPFDFVPSQVDAAADLFDAPFNTVIRVPFYIKYANLLLKALYIIIPLIYIPFSGIENFFLAPLPPEMDTFPGMLRFFGLQAMLGPDYLYDYEDDEAAENDDATAADEGEDPEYYDYEDDVRRNRRKDQLPEKNESKKRKKLKKKQSQEKENVKGKDTRYTNLAHEMRPPPSRYSSQSSYSSITTQDMQPFYVYHVSDSKHPEIHHPQVVPAPVMHDYYDPWKKFNVPPWLSSTQVLPPPSIPGSSLSAQPHPVGVPSIGSYSAPSKPVASVSATSGEPSYGVPVLSGEPIVSVPHPSSASYQSIPTFSSSSIPETWPAIVREDQVEVSRYKPPQSFETQSTRPVLQNESNAALFSQVEKIRENFLVSPNYLGMTTKLVLQSRSETPHVSTSTTPVVRTEIPPSELRPVYVTAPTIIRTSTVINKPPSTASVTH
ncbi:hypothetical protein FHG87_019460 [Trinorchestia longiramus]|nr:hypothetical protein FHG87_019460 [Trinorchestia longiramus]